MSQQQASSSQQYPSSWKNEAAAEVPVNAAQPHQQQQQHHQPSLDECYKAMLAQCLPPAENRHNRLQLDKNPYEGRDWVKAVRFERARLEHMACLQATEFGEDSKIPQELKDRIQADAHQLKLLDPLIQKAMEKNNRVGDSEHGKNRDVEELVEAKHNVLRLEDKLVTMNEEIAQGEVDLARQKLEALKLAEEKRTFELQFERLRAKELG